MGFYLNKVILNVKLIMKFVGIFLVVIQCLPIILSVGNPLDKKSNKEKKNNHSSVALDGKKVTNQTPVKKPDTKQEKVKETKPKVTALHVEIQGNTTVQLPQDSVIL